MLRVIKKESIIILEYRPEINDSSWIDRELEEKGEVRISSVFCFRLENLIKDSESTEFGFDIRKFMLGRLEGSYYKISKDVLDIKFDLLIDKDMKITVKTFIAEGHISIFNKIDELIEEQIVVGGERENAIPTIEFENLLGFFPTKTNLRYYAQSRITGILKDYLGTISDAQKKLNDYLGKQGEIRKIVETDSLYKYEVEKYLYIRHSLIKMLENADSYSEEKWQKLIVKFLLLLFPKYVAVLEKVRIKDFYADLDKPTDRYIDLTLVDANGNIDIIEIKKPFTNCLLSARKYRDNYTPRNELSGAVMQVEKYLFHLSKWGIEGEKMINKSRASELPNNMQIRITNPKGMIVIGRDNDFGRDQKFDLEIIKRKYAHIIDIMTYDDLLQRLENIIAKFKMGS